MRTNSMLMTPSNKVAKSKSIHDDEGYNVVCEIDHPLFDLVDNLTRRQILRLIACEHNYGNRIASILDISTPAVHRHLKQLLGKDSDSKFGIIQQDKKTKESYSGHKGGEATFYSIKTQVGLFLQIFPNFVHSHILELVDDNNPQIPKNLSVPKELKNLKPISKSKLTDSEDDNKKERFYDIYDTVQKYNKRVSDLQKEMMDVLSVKNDFMGEVDTILQSYDDLSYEDRVILRAITCLGEYCSSDLSHLLNMDNYQIVSKVMSLRDRKWID